MRKDGRNPDELLPIRLKTEIYDRRTAVVVIDWGKTHLICRMRVLPAKEAGGINVRFALTEDCPAKEQYAALAEKVAEDLEKTLAQPAKYDFAAVFFPLATETPLYAPSLTGGWTALRLLTNLVRGPEDLDLLQTQVAAFRVAAADGALLLDPTAQESADADFNVDLAVNEFGEFLRLEIISGVQAVNEAEVYGALQMIQGKGEYLMDLQKQAAGVQPAEEQQAIVIATRNAGKAREFKTLFGKAGYRVETLLDYPDLPEVEETGSTFAENARLKAETIARLLDRPVLADDSGLSVDALDGLPGIYSARFAGSGHNDAANNAKLLAMMAPFKGEKRHAVFHCTLAFAAPHKKTLVVSADWGGQIATVPQGNDGFGYDPLFFLPEYDCTAAQLPPEQKNRISHRALAVRKLEKVWQAWLTNKNELEDER